jgi:hypothetical protein
MKNARTKYARCTWVSFVYAFFISFIIQILTVHQFGALGMIGDQAAKAFLCCFHGRL